jgi:hypothetical protein
MPTAKPRVQVSMSPSAYQSLSRLATARRVSRSVVMAELFEAARPALDRLAEVIEAARSAPKDVLQRFASAVEQGESQALTGVEAHLGQLDLLIHGLKDGKSWEASPPARPRAAERSGDVRSRAEQDPRPVTRGSGRGTAPRPTARKDQKKARGSTTKARSRR